VGDLWVQGANGDILRCKTARSSGSFTSSDWEKASKYTDDSALNAFINGNFANTIDNLTNQIDGKVETWFQESDPATAWTTSAMREMHLGDMWYKPTAHELKYYRVAASLQNPTTGIVTKYYGWKLVEDATAIEAYEAASKAQDTADGKRQVFVSTPYPPYDIGDLWVNGKELRRCATPKATGESYNVNDWVIAVDYDNTKTTIDGGIVTSGTIQVAGDNKSILAGVTGQGTAASSIRFWAGASFENRATAPYRVMQDGSVVMTKATVEGVIKALSGTIGSGSTPLQITANGLSYGDVSTWALKSGRKMIISPDSIRIQTINENQGNDTTHPFGRVSFGHYADYSSSYQFGTLAHIYKYDVLSSYSQSLQPAMVIESHTSFGGGLALKTNGAIIARGAISEIGNFIQTDSSAMTIINLAPFEGAVFIVKNAVANKVAQLPAVDTLRYILGISGGTPFAFTIKVISLIGNAAIRLTTPNDGTTLYNGTSKVSSYYTINANTTHEITLFSDGSTHYWKIKNVT
ncbi:MAG: hypothetical protein HDR45_04200, partial [Bacteroides sp.]|nr:hypothetical protein [Bacteroides sp.]